MKLFHHGIYYHKLIDVELEEKEEVDANSISTNRIGSVDDKGNTFYSPIRREPPANIFGNGSQGTCTVMERGHGSQSQTSVMHVKLFPKRHMNATSPQKTSPPLNQFGSSCLCTPGAGTYLTDHFLRICSVVNPRINQSYLYHLHVKDSILFLVFCHH